MVIILQMEAMHVIGYSTLSIRTWQYVYSVKLLNVREKKEKKRTMANKRKKKSNKQNAKEKDVFLRWDSNTIKVSPMPLHKDYIGW